MTQLSVVSYNVRYFGHGTRGLASTRTAMRRIARALAELDPPADIICLQEVETTSIRSTVAHPQTREGETQLERLMQMFSEELLRAQRSDTYEAYYFPAHSYRVTARTPVYTTGLAILAHSSLRVSHHNAKAPAEITHRHIRAVRGLKQTRICAHLRLTDEEGRTIDVFNTHLSLPTTFSRNFWTRTARMGYGPNQLEEAKNLIRFVDCERKSNRFFVCGDFNSHPGSPVYQLITRERGYLDPFAELHRMSEDDLRSWPTAGFLKMRMHLDHIFSGDSLTWLDFDGSHPFGQVGGVFHGLSDHVPIIGKCRVSVPKAASKRPSARPPSNRPPSQRPAALDSKTPASAASIRDSSRSPIS